MHYVTVLTILQKLSFVKFLLFIISDILSNMKYKNDMSFLLIWEATSEYLTQENI